MVLFHMMLIKERSLTQHATLAATCLKDSCLNIMYIIGCLRRDDDPAIGRRACAPDLLGWLSLGTPKAMEKIPQNRVLPGDAVERLIAIMARLRSDAGCPWDRVQTFATIVPYTIEEAYEVADAVESGDMAALCEELGDLLLQVVFHARMAEEAGSFAMAEVVAGIVAKMERRHPHIFGDLPDLADEPIGVAAQRDVWETIKAEEKPRSGALAGVAAALPALMRADKIQKRAARTGFDWPDAAGPRAKIAEELSEFDAATDAAERLDEGGDLLFAVVNYLRHHDVDPEVALRGANAKFERRFGAMELAAGDAFAGLDLGDKEALWTAAKRAEHS